MVKILVEAASQLLEGRSGVLLSHFVLCVFSSYKNSGVSILSSRQVPGDEAAQWGIKRNLLPKYVLQLGKRSVMGMVWSENLHTQISGLYTGL